MTSIRLILALLLAIPIQVTQATTLRVGPDEKLTHIADGQSARTQNPVLIYYGAEGEGWPENSLTLNGNLLISDYLPVGWFLRIHIDKFPASPKVDLNNNRTQGLGIFTPDVMNNFRH